MSIELDWPRLNAIFAPRQDILDGIKRCADTPGKKALFNEIANHFETRFNAAEEPDAKRRKIQNNGVSNGSSSTQASEEPVLLEVKEISVAVPQRKKFEICMTQSYLYARAPGTKVPIEGITYAWTDIEYAFYLPIPEKSQVQHNYILFPRGSYLPSKTAPTTTEPLVFTVPATAPKDGTIGGDEANSAAAVSDSYKTLFHWALGRRLKIAGSDIRIVSADPSKFQSAIRQSHRPNEKAVHVNGFRGSKDGFLFFLENGILWGFKKPLIFIPLNRIAAISYTNILQITFNMVVEVFTDEADATEELEFGMLDQQDYAGIDEFVRQNRLQDRSMADQRKAKLQLAENRAKKSADGGDENGDAENANGMTELEKAQQEATQTMQDADADDDDDEDEDDFDPGSEGESEGSGSSSEEDDEDGDGDGNGNQDDDDDDEEGDYDEDEGEEGDDVKEEEEEEEDKKKPLSIRQ